MEWTALGLTAQLGNDIACFSVPAVAIVTSLLGVLGGAAGMLYRAQVEALRELITAERARTQSEADEKEEYKQLAWSLARAGEQSTEASLMAARAVNRKLR